MHYLLLLLLLCVCSGSSAACPPLSAPVNGSISCTNSTSEGSVCSFSCSLGHSLTGSSHLLCQAGGAWNGSAPTCPAVNCGVLTAPGNGSVSCSGSGYNAMCNFSCITGWSVSGSAQRTCGADGQWSGSTATCVNPLCTADGRMAWGRLLVNDVWATVDLSRYCFSDPVIIPTVNYRNNSIPVLPRLRHSGSATSFQSSFDIRLQNPSGSAVVEESVFWVALEYGMWRMPDGDKLEARRFLSTVTDTDGNFNGVTQSFWHSYANPIVLGAVQSYNDPRFSVFWATAESSVSSPPAPNNFKCGKSVDEDSVTTRNDETLAYIAMESSSGFADNSMRYEALLTSKFVQGVDDAVNNGQGFLVTPGFTSPTVGITQKLTASGPNGGWGVFFGDDPVRPGRVSVAVDEENIGDSERDHTTEQMGLLLFQSEGSTSLQSGCVCGDGIICGPEQCDGGACCSDQCTFRSSGEMCRPESGVCDQAETCNGTSSECPANVFRTPGTSCSGSSQGTCNSFQQCECDAGYYTAFTDSFPCLRYDTVIPACVAPACTLSASWNTSSGVSAVSHAWGAFQDAETGVQYYEWAIGTQTNATAALGWQRVSTSDPRSGTVGGLQLVVGTPYVVWVRAFDAANGTGNVTSSTFHVTSGTVSSPSSSTTQQFSVPLKVSGASDFNERTDVSLQFSNAIEFTSNSFRYIPVTQSAVATEVDSNGSPFLENPFNPPSGLFATGISMSLNRCTTGACTQTDSSSIKLTSPNTFVMTMDLTPTSYRTFMNGSLSLYFYDRAEDEWIPVSSPAYDCDAQGKNVTFDPVTFEVRAELCRTGQFAMFSAQALPVSGGGGGDDGGIDLMLVILAAVGACLLLCCICCCMFFIGRRRNRLEDERRSRLQRRLDMIRNKLQNEQGDMVFKRRPMIAGNATQQAMMAFGGLYRGVAPGGGQPFALPGPAGWAPDGGGMPRVASHASVYSHGGPAMGMGYGMGNGYDMGGGYDMGMGGGGGMGMTHGFGSHYGGQMSQFSARSARTARSAAAYHYANDGEHEFIPDDRPQSPGDDVDEPEDADGDRASRGDSAGRASADDGSRGGDSMGGEDAPGGNAADDAGEFSYANAQVANARQRWQQAVARGGPDARGLHRPQSAFSVLDESAGMGMGMGGGRMHRGPSAPYGLSYASAGMHAGGAPGAHHMMYGGGGGGMMHGGAASMEEVYAGGGPGGSGGGLSRRSSLDSEMWQRARAMRRMSLPSSDWRRPSAFGSHIRTAGSSSQEEL